MGKQTFDFTAQFVSIVSEGYGIDASLILYITGVKRTLRGCQMNSTYEIIMSFSNKSLYWYNIEEAYYQNNESQYAYSYFGIG